MKTLKRWFALFKVRSLEAELDAQNDALCYVRCRHTRAIIRNARELTRHNLAVARAQYTALHAPGARFVWKDA